MNVLTSLDQLKDKKIIFIDKYDVIDTRTLFITEDNCILLETKYLTSSSGVDYIKREYASNMLEIYEELDYSLVDWNIVTLEEFQELEKQWSLKQKSEDYEREELQRERRYEDYLRLKKEFEVDYKL